MSIIKCPRCEINFIKEEDGYCPICLKEMRGEAQKEDDTTLLCIECGERPVVSGEELCVECLKAHQLVADIPIDDSDDDEEEVVKKEEEEELSDEDLSIDEDLPDDIPVGDILDEQEWIDLEDEEEDEEDEFDGFYEEDVHELMNENPSTGL